MNEKEFNEFKKMVEEAGEKPMFFVQTDDDILIGRIKAKDYYKLSVSNEESIALELYVLNGNHPKRLLNHLMVDDKSYLRYHFTDTVKLIGRSRIVKAVLIPPEKIEELLFILLAERSSMMWLIKRFFNNFE